MLPRIAFGAQIPSPQIPYHQSQIRTPDHRSQTADQTSYPRSQNPRSQSPKSQTPDPKPLISAAPAGVWELT